jgi:hypothetical protein
MTGNLEQLVAIEGYRRAQLGFRQKRFDYGPPPVPKVRRIGQSRHSTAVSQTAPHSKLRNPPAVKNALFPRAYIANDKNIAK